MDIIIIVTLSLLGILLLLIEIFLIPGITVTAVLGGLFSFGGVFYAFKSLGTTGGFIVLLLNIIVMGVAFVYLIKSRALDKIALKTDSDSTVVSEKDINIAIGDSGITLSRLNPIGKVKVNNITMEGKSLGDFIDEETEIEVVKVSPTQLLVKQIN